MTCPRCRAIIEETKAGLVRCLKCNCPVVVSGVAKKSEPKAESKTKSVKKPITK